MSMKRSGLPELVRGPFENRTEVLRALQADPEAFDGYAGLGGSCRKISCSSVWGNGD